MAQVIASIEIDQYDDGTFKVSKESASQEAAESGEQTEVPDTQEQSAKNIEDAISIVRTMAGSGENPPAAPMDMNIGINRGKPNAITMR